MKKSFENLKELEISLTILWMIRNCGEALEFTFDEIHQKYPDSLQEISNKEEFKQIYFKRLFEKTIENMNDIFSSLDEKILEELKKEPNPMLILYNFLLHGEEVETVDKSTQKENSEFYKYYYNYCNLADIMILQDCIKRRDVTDDCERHKLKGNYYVACFRGQLSNSIYEYRKIKGLTQQQLSKLSGIDRTMIAKIESVQQLTTLETAIRLLTALDLGITIQPLKESIYEELNEQIDKKEKDTI